MDISTCLEEANREQCISKVLARLIAGWEWFGFLLSGGKGGICGLEYKEPKDQLI